SPTRIVGHVCPSSIAATTVAWLGIGTGRRSVVGIVLPWRAPGSSAPPSIPDLPFSVGGSDKRAMDLLPAVEPLPPIAAVTLPWDAAAEEPTDPVATLAAARVRHGDTFVV